VVVMASMMVRHLVVSRKYMHGYKEGDRVIVRLDSGLTFHAVVKLYSVRRLVVQDVRYVNELSWRGQFLVSPKHILNLVGG
jgi:ribosomal protein L21E